MYTINYVKLTALHCSSVFVLHCEAIIICSVFKLVYYL